ncbi:MAG: acyl-CoA thioesterase [Neisseria sp.]|nr:acyl-CoA thioesterase [Neisseria sp.]
MDETVFTIRNYHLDGYGHVNHARYLELMEEARWRFFERHGLSDGLAGTPVVVSRADIRYLRSAVCGDILHIRSRIIGLHPRSLVIRQTAAFGHNGKTAAQADISLAAVEKGAAADWPPAVFLLLDTLHKAAAPR